MNIKRKAFKLILSAEYHPGKKASSVQEAPVKRTGPSAVMILLARLKKKKMRKGTGMQKVRSLWQTGSSNRAQLGQEVRHHRRETPKQEKKKRTYISVPLKYNMQELIDNALSVQRLAATRVWRRYRYLSVASSSIHPWGNCNIGDALH